MKLLLLCLLLIATKLQLCSTALAKARVQPVDGKCPYNGHLIAPGETINSHTPCKRYGCSVISEDQYVVGIAGCGVQGLAEEDAERCHFEPGPGVYPDCCPQIVCNED